MKEVEIVEPLQNGENDLLADEAERYAPQAVSFYSG
jgi:hypothetical protein